MIVIAVVVIVAVVVVALVALVVVVVEKRHLPVDRLGHVDGMRTRADAFQRSRQSLTSEAGRYQSRSIKHLEPIIQKRTILPYSAIKTREAM